MKLKLDENIGRRGIELLRSAGHDFATVRDEDLQGSTDQKLFDACASEGRVLVTLDRGFGQVLRFAAERTAGVVVVETGPQPILRGLLDRLRDLLPRESQPLPGTPRIVEPGRIRVHLRDHDE